MTADTPRPDHDRAQRPVAGLAHDQRGGISNPILGMILFITSEVMFFAGLFAAYFNARASAPRGRRSIPRRTQPSTCRSCRSSGRRRSC